MIPPPHCLLSPVHARSQLLPLGAFPSLGRCLIVIVNHPLSVECIICQDMFRITKTFQAPCGDHYCRACLLDLITAATRDETLFPVRCCQQNIPIDNLDRYIDAATLALFRTKSIDFGTPTTE